MEPQRSGGTHPLQIIGGIVLIVGFAVWFLTDDDVIAPGLVTIAIGFVILGIGSLMRNARDNAANAAFVEHARAQHLAGAQVQPAPAAHTSPEPQESASVESAPDDGLYNAALAVADPQTSGAELADIAGRFPSLWPHVRRHPHVYPELLAWMDSFPSDPGSLAGSDSSS